MESGDDALVMMQKQDWGKLILSIRFLFVSKCVCVMNFEVTQC